MDNLSKLKISSGLGLLAALAIGAYLMLPHAETSGSGSTVQEDLVSDVTTKSIQEGAQTRALVTSKNNTQIDRQDSSIASQVSKVVSNEPVTLAGNPAQAAVVKNWMEARGHYGPDDDSLNEYKAYDLETLERLAEAGDLKAMVALGWLYLSVERYGRPDSLVKYEGIMKRAALYGSTAALGSLSSFQSKPEVTDEDLIERFAWAHVGTLRGDMWPSENAMSDARIYKFEFTDAAVTQIKARAHELYNQLEQQRIEMGLGNFDNSRPPEVDNLFRNLGGFMPIPE
jgi:hypothetical protein